MKVPNAEHAMVASEKIAGYLLNPAHPAGGPKSVFFRAFGFRMEEWKVMAESLRYHVQAYDYADARSVIGAVSYRVIGPLITPDTRNPLVLSAWYIREGETMPRFVTAFPAPEGRLHNVRGT